ncbi:RNA polymerase sigma-70 factor, ECF subfamily [Klenkia soli]|uniref:RNA polymerase sigma-70 factor, ECF subfamily n=1 Tax=Klenkia soli TaxID=1052260 RepID=A0A1H0DC24_9ACTN|nr:sigma-70 family RNA polymerase sigma factor [Klenkia soli]SDN67694.1 RNA polymerase sigma-70 factor, ECF subfamily [Klenkia soli]
MSLRGRAADPVDAVTALPPPRPRPRPRPAPSPRRPVDEAPASHRVPEPTPAPEPVPEPVPKPVPEPPSVPAEVEQPAQPEGEEQVTVWALVEQAQAGDAEAFGRLYDRYADMVFRFLYHRVTDRQTAEDFTSETFVRALRRIDSLSFQGRDVGAWLVTIARNIVLDHVKSSRFRLEVTIGDMRDADRVTDGPEDAVLQNLTNAELLACVAQLGDEQRECIALRFLQGLSVAETAAAMGKKDGAIKALQHRAVKRLAALLPEGLR